MSEVNFNVESNLSDIRLEAQGFRPIEDSDIVLIKQIKQDVLATKEDVDKKIDAFDEKVATAKATVDDLEKKTDAGIAIKSQLEETIATANTAKNNLDRSVINSNSALQSLTAENVSATYNLEQLRSENFNSKDILAGVADLRAYLGLTDNDVLGIQIDLKNRTFKRLAGATNLTAGADFDHFPMFGGRKRCNVADNGTINAYYGDESYIENGSNGQVMVYQPKFYYLTYPLAIDPVETGIGYHLRKANYYVSSTAKAGFKLHPAFYDSSGNPVDYILFSAYEGSIFDVSANAYILDDAQIVSQTTDKFCSVSGAKPASGLTQNLTRPNIEQMAQNRGVGWHGNIIKAESANQLLMIVEMGMMNMQTAIGQGVVNIADNSAHNCSSLTGSTASLGNATGSAISTVNEKGGVQTVETVAGKVSITYRGMENPWGNIWKFVNGINIWGNGTLGGGVPYYATDFNFAESKKTDNYVSAGFSCANAGGYVSAIGYSPECDWLFIGSEVLGNSSVPVGDYQWTNTNLNSWRIARLGGGCEGGTGAGAFYWTFGDGVGSRHRNAGGRLVYVPTAMNVKGKGENHG